MPLISLIYGWGGSGEMVLLDCRLYHDWFELFGGRISDISIFYSLFFSSLAGSDCSQETLPRSCLEIKCSSAKMLEVKEEEAWVSSFSLEML